MRGPLKLLLWLLAGMGLLTALLLALPFLVDVNLYRGQIERQISNAFGREILLEGPLKLEPSLTPRFQAKGLKISNPDWASRPFLAMVDRFDIRVSLLPLLRGDLKILSLEFYGVDLLLEKTAAGANNFTFGETGEPAPLPVIDHLALHDIDIAYAAANIPPKRLQVKHLTGRNTPDRPLAIEAQTKFNGKPVQLSLRGEPLQPGWQPGPWRINLQGKADKLSLQLEGEVAELTDWSRGEFRLQLTGDSLTDLDPFSGSSLPPTEPFVLNAHIGVEPDQQLTISKVFARLGDSELSGHLRWDMSVSPPGIELSVNSQRLDVGDLGFAPSPGQEIEQTVEEALAQTVDSALLRAFELDARIRIQRLEGLDTGVEDILVEADMERGHINLPSAKARVNGIDIAASGTLPWVEQSQPTLPATVSIEQLLQQAKLDIRAHASKQVFQYTTRLMDRPFDFSLSSVEASARPEAATTIKAEAVLNGQPVTLRLQGEPLASLLQQPTGPWRGLTLQARGDDIRIDASGNLDRPFDALGFDLEYSANGPELYHLLPLRGAWSVSGRYANQPSLQRLERLDIRVGRSSVKGRIDLRQEGERSGLAANLASPLIHLDELLMMAGEDTAAGADLDQTLDLGDLPGMDLNLELRVERLEGLVKPLQDLLVVAQADSQRLTLAPIRGAVDEIRVDARAQLPWGRNLAGLDQHGIQASQLLRQADITLQGQVAKGKLRYQTSFLDQPVELELRRFQAKAKPDEALRLSASGLVDDTPIGMKLQTEPLATLLQRPAGPWQNMKLDARWNDIQFQARGGIETPLEPQGFDVRYELQGDEIQSLLPVFNLVLPLEGAYSLSGRFTDQADGVLLDDLKIRSGESDIGGSIHIHQAEQRPRLIADFYSDQLYLRELLPVTETEQSPAATGRVIPDYQLPIEYMRRIDGELQFRGKRLRTDAGDLGFVNFKATLNDGVFRLDPFRVRGWAGAIIESDLNIDATQEPPVIAWRWIARQLNYGVLLQQAGAAETVEGTIDVNFQLSGTGSSRYEMLKNADGQLVIIGREGRFGSRWLELWGSALITTMLSPRWHREDVTNLNCIVAHVDIEDGIANLDGLLIDTQRITIGASGTLNLESEELNLVFAPRPRRTTLLSLTNPARVTGTLAEPEATLTVLPGNRIRAAGSGVLAGLINPAYLIFTFSQMGTGGESCTAAINKALVMKGESETLEASPSPARRISVLPGCSANSR